MLIAHSSKLNKMQQRGAWHKY